MAVGWIRRPCAAGSSVREMQPGSSRFASMTSATLTARCSSPAGIDLASVKAAMGHSRITTTERYLHARPAGELADRFTRAPRGPGSAMLLADAA
jgi:hypothetical protein